MSGRSVGVAILGVATLTACGGGGGNSPSAAAPAPAAAIVFNAASDMVTFAGNTQVSAASTPNAAQITFSTDAGGNPTIALNIPTAGAPFVHTFNLNTAVQAPITSPLAGFLAVADATSTLVLDDTLSFSSFGFWVNATSATSGSMGGIAFGSTPTPLGGLPAGSATYTGRLVGGAVDGTNQVLLQGPVSLTANFTGMTMSGTLTANNISSGTAVPWATLTLASTPIANTAGFPFGGSGVLSGTLPVGGAVTSSNLNGGFFGPAAQETVGTFSVANGSTRAAGAFGAAR